MEKLKQAKHNHLLTDWLKVGIFALLLLLPFFVFAPTAFYYGFNEHATAPTKQVENTTTIHMQQNVINGLPSGLNNIQNHFNSLLSIDNGLNIVSDDNSEQDMSVSIDTRQFNVNTNDILLTKVNIVNYENISAINIYCENDNASTEIIIYEDVVQELIQVRTIYEYTNDVVSFLFIDFNWDNFNLSEITLSNLQVFNLTQMFGSGYEPTIEEFNSLFPNDYYAYDSDATAEWPNGTYTTYTDISSTMAFAWESMFDTPLLKWTKDSPFKTSINGFLTLFQIPQQSGIGLYLNYLITMVCIYVVFDIVIQLFKWLTHIIGEK